MSDSDKEDIEWVLRLMKIRSTVLPDEIPLKEM